MLVHDHFWRTAAIGDYPFGWHDCLGVLKTAAERSAAA
jgi:hypothetical protein